jgi:hypothetical protein
MCLITTLRLIFLFVFFYVLYLCLDGNQVVIHWIYDHFVFCSVVLIAAIVFNDLAKRKG